jgi:hypothetical protein
MIAKVIGNTTVQIWFSVSFIKKERINRGDCENQKYQMSFKWKTSSVACFCKQDGEANY